MMSFLKKKVKKTLKVYIRKNGISLSYIKDGEPTYTHSNEVDDISDLSFALKQMMQQIPSVSAYETEIILSQSFYEIHHIEKPKVPSNELYDSIPWTVKELTAIPIDTLLYDYTDIVAKSADPKIQIILADKNFVKQFTNVCAEIKAYATKISTEEFAIASIADDFDNALFITCNGIDDLLITISVNGKNVLSRRVQGVTAICDDVELLLDQLIENVVLEIQRSIDYFSGQVSDSGLHKCYVAMNGKNNDRLAKEIMEATELRTMAILPDARLGDMAPCISIKKDKQDA